jgi:molybdate transport system ATP-binding protein
MTRPFITLNDVSIRLHDRLLFEDLCWDMLDDEHWAVVGPNGSGKSVLMKALCGTAPVVRGQLVYHFAHDGRPQDHIAYVTFESQRTVLGVGCNGVEYNGAVSNADEAFYQARWNAGVESDAVSVDEYLSERGVRQINPFHVVQDQADPGFELRREKVIEQLELGALRKRTIMQLSNGERRKVLIARAWLKAPRLLILDNPFAGLDERFRSRLKANLENLTQGDLRVIVVGTHRDEIPRSVTHVLCLEKHRAAAQGPRPMVWRDGQSNHARLADRFIAVTEPPDSASPILVQMENVNVSYNGTPVLDQVSWTVRENEQWALLGPNGAGKTTLLSLILADNPQAYANDVTLFGQRRGSGESIWEIKQNIGWVAPELHLYSPRGATCLDVVCSGFFDSVGLYRRPLPHQRETALAWMRRLGLVCARAAFAQVSEGEQRLALVARAMVKQPALLVLDEPCQGLDATNRDRVLQAIDSVGGGKTSLIYVTHRADELPRSITHVLRLDNGRVVGRAMTRN